VFWRGFLFGQTVVGILVLFFYVQCTVCVVVYFCLLILCSMCFGVVCFGSVL